MYAAILEPTIRLFTGIRNPSEAAEALRQIQSFEYRPTMFEINLMGTDEVVEAYTNFMQQTYRQQIDTREMMRAFGNLLLAI